MFVVSTMTTADYDESREEEVGRGRESEDQYRKTREKKTHVPRRVFLKPGNYISDLCYPLFLKVHSLCTSGSSLILLLLVRISYFELNVEFFVSFF